MRFVILDPNQVQNFKWTGIIDGGRVRIQPTQLANGDWVIRECFLTHPDVPSAMKNALSNFQAREFLPNEIWTPAQLARRNNRNPGNK